MLRYLPLIFLLVACSRDPLVLEVIETKEAVAETGLQAIEGLAEGAIPEDLTLLEEHEDLTIKFAYRLAEGGKANLLLEGEHAFSLDQARLQEMPARTEMVVAPGSWQEVELSYKAATEDNPALVVAAYLNGNLLYYQQPLSGKADGPLTIKRVSGEVEIADVEYSSNAGRSSTIDPVGNINLNVPLLRYELYDLEPGTADVKNWASRKPVVTGYTNRFDINYLREGKNAFALRFFGKLNVPKAEEYTFQMWTSNPARGRLYIDGDERLHRGGDQSTWRANETLSLSEGEHDVRVDYIQKGGWNAFNLGYLVGDQDKMSFNSMDGTKAIARPGGTNALAVEMDEYPYLLRSFLYYPAPKVYEASDKRTHVISVGEGEGPHYSLDLQSGALLQVWRGGFADVHEMWDGRGEPQVMKPLGNSLVLDGRMQWSTSATISWPVFPEDPDEDDFAHRAHELDEAGRPTFLYSFGPGEVSDKIIPEGTGLLRELTFTAGGNPEAFTQIAAARAITETAPGQYELRGPGLQITIESYDGEGLSLQRGGGMDRLIAQIPAKGHIRYRIDW